MPTVTLDEIAAHAADVLLPPDAEFAEDYAESVRWGRRYASENTVAIVAICRNAMPWLPQTLRLIEETGSMFREFSCFIYENDSTDDTKEVLTAWSDGIRRHVSISDNGRPHLNYTTAPVRTHALAEYRTACQRFVTNGDLPDYVIVLDTDPWGGWSVDGVATSIYHMTGDRSLYGLAAYSWAESQGGVPIHYDAFAARLNHWRQRDQQWFHRWHPPVGSPPIEFRSAFGQMAVYRARRFIQGTYRGDDCEHVCLHRSIEVAASLDEGVSYTRLALNPSMRCVSFWVPGEVKCGG